MEISNIRFKVKKITYRDNDKKYTILRAVIIKESLKLKIPKEVTIKGIFPIIFEGDEMECNAVYLLDEVYGYYFQVKDIPNIIKPENEKALVDFIKKRVNRLGIKTAKSIVDSLGLDTLRLIKEDYRVLTSIKGISENKAHKIYDDLIRHESFENLAIFIQSLGIEASIAVKIYDKFEDASISRIRVNPYCICSENIKNHIPYKYAEKIAYKLNKPFDFAERVKMGVLEYINHRVNNFGDLCVYKSMILKDLNQFLNSYGFYKEELSIVSIESALKELKLNNLIVFETDNQGNECVYAKLWNVIENHIVKDLDNLLTEFIPPFCMPNEIDKFIANYEAKYFTLDVKQKDAVYMALQNRFSILTGGPGTGKTQTTNTIVQCIKSVKPTAKILLLAPTGKASNRMTELTNMEASTIHRALKLHCFAPGKEVEPVCADYVVVDESSMIDAYIFHKLLASIDEGTRILFVGDVNQLPSVGAGLILRDMIDSGVIPVTQLTKIFRQAESSDIVRYSHAMINGVDSKTGIDLTNKPNSNFIFWQDNNPDRIRQKILMSIDRLMSHYNYSKNDICVLTAMRVGDLGSQELNRLLQDKLNPQSPNKTEYAKNDLDVLRYGDKVMQTVNNYDLDVFNGDVGIISKIYVEIEDGKETSKVEVEYPKKTVIYTEEEIDQLELAYAMTIHKSQGSEFKAVIMPLHLSQAVSLNRNLIYTGVTRAKEMMITVGDIEAFDYAIEHVEVCVRISRLKEKIKKINIGASVA